MLERAESNILKFLAGEEPVDVKIPRAIFNKARRSLMKKGLIHNSFTDAETGDTITDLGRQAIASD